MSDITPVEQKKLEKILEMHSGFVLDFTNAKFQQFVSYSVNKNIYDQKYSIIGESKANRLRCFWKLESNQICGKLIKDLLEYAEDMNNYNNDTLFNKCSEISKRLLQTISLEIDLDSEKDLNILAETIKESVNKNLPETGLDRLHTYAIKYLRNICKKRGISAGSPPKSLDSLLGEYRNLLLKTKEIESETTGEILKSAGSVFKRFNNTRNKESLAHDNVILNKDESLLILKYVTATLAFIKIIEKRRIDNLKILAENIRSKILVSEVVKKKVVLRKSNKEFIGLCPFHNEKTPSFTVNDEKGFYHCFGCAAHGDSITFVMNNEQVDYIDAITKLTDDFNIKSNQT